MALLNQLENFKTEFWILNCITQPSYLQQADTSDNSEDFIQPTVPLFEKDEIELGKS